MSLWSGSRAKFEVIRKIISISPTSDLTTQVRRLIEAGKLTYVGFVASNSGCENMVQRENPRVKRALDKLNAIPNTKAIKIHGSVEQQKGTPDIIGCCIGKMFVVEMKTEEGHLSAIQTKRLTEWYNSLAVCIVSTDADEVERLVRRVYNDSTFGGNWDPPAVKIDIKSFTISEE